MLWSMVLPNPMPGSIQISPTPAPRAASARPTRYSRTSATTSSYTGSSCIVRGSPRLFMATHPVPVDGATSASSGEPDTSLTMVAPAATAAAATAGLRVSMLTRTSGASSSMTGSTRRSSSASSTGSAPGLVDSPPTSTMSAPSATSCRPCSTAAPGSNHRPPSEKESGVTFSTPITRQLSPAAMDGRSLGGSTLSVRSRSGFAGRRSRISRRPRMGRSDHPNRLYVDLPGEAGEPGVFLGALEGGLGGQLPDRSGQGRVDVDEPGQGVQLHPLLDRHRQLVDQLAGAGPQDVGADDPVLRSGDHDDGAVGGAVGPG